MRLLFLYIVDVDFQQEFVSGTSIEVFEKISNDASTKILKKENNRYGFKLYCQQTIFLIAII